MTFIDLCTYIVVGSMTAVAVTVAMFLIVGMAIVVREARR